MDSIEVKRRGRKPREVAAPEVAVVAPVEDAPEPVAVEIVPVQPAAPAFVILIPVWLRDSAIPLNEQIPADIRQAAQSALGCVVRFKAGQLHAADGRVFRAEIKGDVIEVFSA